MSLSKSVIYKVFCTTSRSFFILTSELGQTLSAMKEVSVFESDYNRHFSYLPHNTILYSNNLINPVGALDTPDDLILKYSSTRINTVLTVFSRI